MRKVIEQALKKQARLIEEQSKTIEAMKKVINKEFEPEDEE